MPSPKQKHFTTVSLLRPDMEAERVQKVIETISEVVVEAGGKVAKTEYWGLKPLATKIKKNRKAHYALLNIDAPPAAVAEMERRMSLSADIMRFLTIRTGAEGSDPDPAHKREMDSHFAAAALDSLDEIEATLQRINEGLEATLREIATLKG